MTALMLIWMQIYYVNISAYQFRSSSLRLNRFFYGFKNVTPISWSSTNLRMNEMDTVPEKRKMSWPFNSFDAPDVLDGKLAGDAGFDPLRLATDRESLFILREAEIKHARLAMLAAVGWPISELYHYKLAILFSVPNELVESAGRAPSVLNGGLDNWVSVFILLLLASV